MSSGFRKFLLVLGALLIAGFITYYPWTYMDELTGDTSAFYGMTAIYWAPAALFVGVVSGFFFAFALWPRKSAGPTKAETSGPSSIEV